MISNDLEWLLFGIFLSLFSYLTVRLLTRFGLRRLISWQLEKIQELVKELTKLHQEVAHWQQLHREVNEQGVQGLQDWLRALQTEP